MLNKYFSTAPSDFSMGISGGRRMSNEEKIMVF
jgi:hypothetical protein